MRTNIARLYNYRATQSLNVPSAGRVQWLRGGASPEMEKGMMDLKITNPGKDYFIEQPKEEQSVWRESASNHGEVGKLETKVL